MIVKKEEVKPSLDMEVRVKRCGAVTKVTMLRKAIKEGSVVKKIDKDRWMDTRTGEIKEFIHHETRMGNVDGIRKTMVKIRDIINTNVVKAENVRWVTLTYAENMKDENRLYKDYDAFRKRLYRYCEKEGYGRPEYITVVEPQARGAWHVHAFYIWEGKAPYIANEKLREIWGNGFVKITALENVDNPGAYFTAYLTDMPIDEALQNGIGGEVKEGKDGKKYIKGSRLYMYPKGMNFYRTSRGIKRPNIEKISVIEYEKEKDEYGTLVFQEKFGLYNDDEHLINKVIKLEYNKNRKSTR